VSEEIDSYWSSFYQRLQDNGLDEGWCYWFVGLIEGEGSFTYSRQSHGKSIIPQFSLILQHDTKLMQEMHEILGLGRMYWIEPKAPRRGGGKFAPRMTWQIRKKSELAVMVDFFERYKMRSKKADDFSIWKLMVKEYVENGGGSQKLKQLALALSKTGQKTSGQSKYAQRKLEESSDDPKPY